MYSEDRKLNQKDILGGAVVDAFAKAEKAERSKTE